MISRDERQQICVNKWLANRGVGTLIQPTGCGKTTTALKCIQKVLSLYPHFRVLVVVPTTNLKEQWEDRASKFGINNITVLVINTVSNKEFETDLLIIDEVHVSAATQFSNIFKVVKYKLILGLTATLHRLDGKHKIIEKYCPIVDEITLIEASTNKWLSEYTEYLVLLDVDNIHDYNKANSTFFKAFEFFGFDFNLVMSFLGKDGFENRKAYTTKMCKDKTRWNEYLQAVTTNTMAFKTAMTARKNFINNHSKKIEIAKLIIENRPFSKIITFSNNIKMAEAIGGPVYSGKDTKKKGRMTLEEFEQCESGVINSSKKLIAGADIAGVNCEIVLGQDSSSIRATQLRGRAIRKEGNKHSEIFNIVINDTQEVSWFSNSHKDTNFVVIDEENLLKVLRGEEYEPYKKPLSKFNYRF